MTLDNCFFSVPFPFENMSLLLCHVTDVCLNGWWSPFFICIECGKAYLADECMKTHEGIAHVGETFSAGVDNH